MAPPPKNFLVFTENGSRYDVDVIENRIRELYRKPFMGVGSKTLADGERHEYAILQTPMTGNSLVVYWPSGQALMTSRITLIVEVV